MRRLWVLALLPQHARTLQPKSAKEQFAALVQINTFKLYFFPSEIRQTFQSAQTAHNHLVYV